MFCLVWRQVALLAGLAAITAAQDRPPNILFILADDLGWTAPSVYGNRYVTTSNLDGLAREGMRFTQAYATPQCTPTRASFLTGQHTARNRMWHVIPRYGYPWARLREPMFRENLERSTATFPKLLRKKGYRTGIIGKWHLTVNQDGSYEQLLPEASPYYGFDWAPPRHDPPRIQARTDKGVDFFTSQAIRFIEENRDRPFFLYLSHHTIHGPVLAPEALVAKYRAKGHPETGLHNATYLAAIEHLDTSVGRLLKRLDELGLTGRTLVVFFSDNGGVDREFSNHPLRYGKGTAYEGGLRVPLIVRWPGRVAPGAVEETPVHVVDFYPTFLEIAGAGLPPDHPLDGVSLVPLLTGEGAWKREALYWHLPLYDTNWGAVPSAAVRQGDWKLIEFFGDFIDRENGNAYRTGRRVELYNLARDVGEQRDLASRETDRRDALLQRLHDWLGQFNDVLPRPNPDFDPSRALQMKRPWP